MDPSSTAREPLPGYEDGINYGELAWLLVRLMLALYLLASALAAFDVRVLTPLRIAVRLALSAGILMRPEIIQFGAILAAFAVLSLHHFRDPKPV
jgi:uncharacterized membrane protein (DUF485 family)